MRPPSANQRPRTYAKPTASHRAIGRCRAVSISVSPRVRKGKTLANTAPAAKGSASQRPLTNVQPTLPHEVDREQREDEQAGVPDVEQRQLVIRAERKTEQRRHLDGQRRGDGKAQDDERLGV